MKNLKFLPLLAAILFVSSCASVAKFPISSVTPAAQIKAKMTHDKNKNSLIEVTAKNLASATRLNPPKNNYVVWITTENNGIMNIGQLMNKNGKKTSLNVTTPFIIQEIFITAEEQGNISYPSGVEISRTKF